jgi:hypothetical protein
MSDSNKNLVVDHRWGPDTKTNWSTDRRSQYNLNLSERVFPFGGGLEYFYRSPASRKRRRKGNPVPGGISGPPCSWGMWIREPGVSNETVEYGREFYGTRPRDWLLWQGPEAIVLVNYRPILSSEREPHSKKTAIFNKKILSWEPDTTIDWPTHRRS